MPRSRKRQKMYHGKWIVEKKYLEMSAISNYNSQMTRSNIKTTKTQIKTKTKRLYRTH
jgi:hypothetical protein